MKQFAYWRAEMNCNSNGNHDEGNPVERVIPAARYIPKHLIAIIPNTGYGCFLENFPATWASIEPFLKK